MSSIMTNTGAMTALQTMRNINRGMETVQNQISTGLKVGSAKDNSATWAISKVMESDVAGFKAIKENLALGSSTVNVARNAAETTTELLTEIKEKIVQAQEENVDRSKIQADITQLRDQIASVTGAAQFNGLNLVDNMRTETVLSSLDRSGGGVSASRINVDSQDLTMRELVFGNGTAPPDMASLTAPGDLAAAVDGTAGRDMTITGPAGDDGFATMTFNVPDSGLEPVTVRVEVLDGMAADVVAGRFRDAISENETLREAGVRVEGTGAEVNVRLTGEARMRGLDAITFDADGTGIGGGAGAAIDANATTVNVGTGTIEAGHSFQVSFGGETFQYVANDRSTRDDVLAGLAKAINESGQFFAEVNDDDQIAITANSTAAVTGGGVATATGGRAAGGLSDLNSLDVADFSSLRGGPNGTTIFGELTEAQQREVMQASLQRSLEQIEGMIQTSIDAAASFGQVQKRIEIQDQFVGNLMDSLRAGIGSLVDADMEEASARLQALQVQQQLGIQSLTIANQQPQNILSLFR